MNDIIEQLSEQDARFDYDELGDEIAISMDGNLLATVRMLDDGALLAFDERVAPVMAATIALAVDAVVEVTVDDDPVTDPHENIEYEDDDADPIY